MVKVKSEKDVFIATGRRKTAIARVRLVPGSGKIFLNKLPMAEYLDRKMLELKVMEPLNAVQKKDQFDIIARVHGGGKAGQAGALRHGIARALVEFDAELRPTLKKGGFLTRDPRMRERKKYGRKRARRGFQWTKR